MRNVAILVVDDSAADRVSIRVAFERSGVPLNLHFASSGRQALELLRAKNETSKAFRPQLMFVDVKMPGISGLDLLRALKADDELLNIPVFMFSGSDDQSDIQTAYRSFASGYICKPSSAEGLNEMASVLARLCSSVLAYAI